MSSIRAKVRVHTHRRFASRDLRDVVARLNPVLRGWGAYYVPNIGLVREQTIRGGNDVLELVSVSI